MSSLSVTKRASLPLTSNFTVKTLLNKTDLLLSNWHRLSKPQVFKKYQPNIPIDLISIASKYSKKVVHFDIYDKNHWSRIKYPTYDLFQHTTDVNFPSYEFELLCSVPITNNDGFNVKIDEIMEAYGRDYSIKIGVAWHIGYEETMTYFFDANGATLANSNVNLPLIFKDWNNQLQKDDIIKIKVINNKLWCWINDIKLNSSKGNCDEICHDLNKLHFRIRFSGLKSIKFRISDCDQKLSFSTS